MNGTFTYQNRVGSRMLSILILIITVAIAYCVRVAVGSPVLTLVTFAACLFILSICTIPLNRRLFFKEGSYQFNEDDSVTIRTKQEWTFKKSQVKGVGCDPVEDRKSKSTRVYKISVIPNAGKPLEIFSDNVMVDNQNSEEKLKPFLTFGALLKHWKYGQS